MVCLSKTQITYCISVNFFHFFQILWLKTSFSIEKNITLAAISLPLVSRISDVYCENTLVRYKAFWQVVSNRRKPHCIFSLQCFGI